MTFFSAVILCCLQSPNKGLTELSFYDPLDTKWVILEAFFPVNLLAKCWKTEHNKSKHASITKYTIAQNKHKLKSGLVTSYNRRSSNVDIATFHQPTQLWEIDPSLLLVHICGTIYHFIYVNLNYHFFEFRRLLKTHLFGWGSWRLVTYFRCSALYKCTYLLTNKLRPGNGMNLLLWK